MRCSETGQGRNKENTRTWIRVQAKPINLRRRTHGLEAVSDPLDRRPGDKDASLREYTVGPPLPESPRAW